MSGSRSTIILAGILGLLVSIFFLFIVEEKEIVEVERLFKVDTTEIVQVNVMVNGVTTTLEKVPMVGWEITAPLRYPADLSLIHI